MQTGLMSLSMSLPDRGYMCPTSCRTRLPETKHPSSVVAATRKTVTGPGAGPQAKGGVIILSAWLRSAFRNWTDGTRRSNGRAGGSARPPPSASPSAARWRRGYFRAVLRTFRGRSAPAIPRRSRPILARWSEREGRRRRGQDGGSEASSARTRRT